MEIAKKILKVKVNGRPYEMLIKPKTTLLQLLRNDLGLTGAKQACMDNSCGACTVIVDKMAVKACSVLALQVNGREVTTVEGLASRDGKLHPLQQTFLDFHAFQCGFCTPGKLMSAKAMLDENLHPNEEDIRRDMEGNLCRCTGYKQYIDAIKAVAQKKEGAK
ncbi:MAG: (2Fe-2S)-binding protein [Deltaproteobacteria bacterium CG03_land_8_20_14_0_80_45_14]|jgi:carbon-monoxide dehydrogenase small subunit|nr:MAG: (2Fe-2S)-binding protein [Deltaproteobacteria bacterium CG03_land_8_20_14_0_80_45_14]